MTNFPVFFSTEVTSLFFHKCPPPPPTTITLVADPGGTPGMHPQQDPILHFCQKAPTSDISTPQQEILDLPLISSLLFNNNIGTPEKYLYHL